ncbi:MAG: hypothetical protein ACPHRO_06345 [Nannocystaceae bacterium]
MLHRLRAKFPLPRIPPRIAVGLLVLWGASLVFVDYGVRIQAIMPVPLVRDFADCQLDTRPAETAIVTVMQPGMTGKLMGTRPAGAAATCYDLLLKDGSRGWVPWHPQYLRDGGGYFHISSWLLSDSSPDS